MRVRWTDKFHRAYPNQKFNKKELSKRFGIPYSTLNKVYARGEAAGRAAGVNPYSWAVPRVYKFILIHVGKVRAPKRNANRNLH